jgi:hypothetical protein
VKRHTIDATEQKMRPILYIALLVAAIFICPTILADDKLGEQPPSQSAMAADPRPANGLRFPTSRFSAQNELLEIRSQIRALDSELAAIDSFRVTHIDYDREHLSSFKLSAGKATEFVEQLRSAVVALKLYAPPKEAPAPGQAGVPGKPAGFDYQSMGKLTTCLTAINAAYQVPWLRTYNELVGDGTTSYNRKSWMSGG